MTNCDKCGKPARPFIYGDLVNSAYDTIDLCYECTKEIKEIIWKFIKDKK